MRRRNFLGYSCLFLAGCSSSTFTSSTNLPAKLRFAVADVRGFVMLGSQLEPAIVAELQPGMFENQAKLPQAIRSAENLSSRFRDAVLAPANDADYDMVREAYRAIRQGEFIQ